MADNKEVPKTKRNWRNTRATLIAVAVIGLTALVYLGLVVRETEPNYYQHQPARYALITAKQRLEESYSAEVQLLEQLQKTHQDLEAAIAALDQASIDLEQRSDVETLRTRLRALEDVSRLKETSPEQLRNSYHAIVTQLEVLIERLEDRDNDH